MIATLPAQSYAELNALGRQDAIELIQRITAEEKPFLLGHRVKIMIESGQYGGYEIGFFQAIAAVASKA